MFLILFPSYIDSLKVKHGLAEHWQGTVLLDDYVNLGRADTFGPDEQFVLESAQFLMKEYGLGSQNMRYKPRLPLIRFDQSMDRTDWRLHIGRFQIGCVCFEFFEFSSKPHLFNRVCSMFRASSVVGILLLICYQWFEEYLKVVCD